jgi:hypothetical protein
MKLHRNVELDSPNRWWAYCPVRFVAGQWRRVGSQLGGAGSGRKCSRESCGGCDRVCKDSGEAASCKLKG